MIPPDLIIQLKGCSAEQRSEIKNILLQNYMKVLDNIEKEADYCDVVGYWKDFIPMSRPITKAEDFIKKYSK